ncbi:MAG: LysR family transcriptional regulator [Gammaproteobacteria bacterium]|nr:LysR family transcriptional regulator [Gammaproteobacteria bacterium]
MRKHTKQSPSPVQLIDGELRIGGYLNARLFNLLEAVERIGSINRAAREVGLSYKGAWEMIERANSLSPRLLIETATGGRDGGGTKLTETGRKLLSLFSRLQEEHRLFLDDLNRNLADDPELLLWLRRLFMKASARNQWFGTVTKVDIGAVNAEVYVALKGGATLVAAVTKESITSLGIAQGKEVLALVKAPLVMVVTDLEGYKLSARNQLVGTISHLQKGSVNAEVVIGLPGGDSVAATITNESVDSLGLAVGIPATAVFKAGAVILGVSA